MQVKESVNASNFLLVGNQTQASKGISVSGNRVETSDFASFLTKSKKESNHDIQIKSEKQEVSEAGNSKHQDVYSKENVISEDAVGGREEIHEKALEEPEDISDEKLEEVLAVIGNILQMVMEQLQLTPEQLVGKLDEFGMNVSDLMTADGLKEFFLNFKSADVSDLIASENLNQEWQAFMDEFNSILEEKEIGSDTAAFMTNEDLSELVSDDSFLQDGLSEDGMKPTSMEVEEPEVVVSQQKEAVSQNGKSSSENQNPDTGTPKQSQEGESTKQTTIKVQQEFENPILQAIQDAVNQVEESTAMTEQPVKGMDIIEQIVEQVRVNMNQNTTSMELQLYPEHLGRIQIHVVSKDGAMTAKIVAETEAAKQAIESGLANLKDTLQQQDLKVDAIEVMVSTTGFERGSEEQDTYEKDSNAKAKKRIDLSELEEEIPVEETEEIERMKATGSSVSYMA